MQVSHLFSLCLELRKADVRASAFVQQMGLGARHVLVCTVHDMAQARTCTTFSHFVRWACSLPQDPAGMWWEIEDEKSGGVCYYFNTKTKETTWVGFCISPELCSQFSLTPALVG